jgi:hypothetical protein
MSMSAALLGPAATARSSEEVQLLVLGLVNPGPLQSPTLGSVRWQDARVRAPNNPRSCS